MPLLSHWTYEQRAQTQIHLKLFLDLLPAPASRLEEGKAGYGDGFWAGNQPCAVLFAAFSAHFRRTARKDKIANSGVRLQQDSVSDMARQSQSTALPQAGASLTRSPFRHSTACSFFPTGASSSRGPRISCLTLLSAAADRGKVSSFPYSPCKARDHQLQHA